MLKSSRTSQPNNTRSQTVLVCAAVLSTILLIGCEARGHATILDHAHDPLWLPFVLAPEINNVEDLDALWRGSPRCCGELSVALNNKIFYKTCSKAIDRHPQNETLVVKCLWLMDIAVQGEDAARIQQIVLDRYYHFDAPVNNCMNCAPGDIVSRVALDLSSYYATNRDSEAAARLLEDVLDRRGDETSPWIRIEIQTQLCRLYRRAGIDPMRQQRIDAAHQEFAAMKDETIARRFDEFQTACKTWTGPE